MKKSAALYSYIRKDDCRISMISAGASEVGGREFDSRPEHVKVQVWMYLWMCLRMPHGNPETREILLRSLKKNGKAVCL